MYKLLFIRFWRSRPAALNVHIYVIEKKTEWPSPRTKCSHLRTWRNIFEILVKKWLWWNADADWEQQNNSLLLFLIYWLGILKNNSPRSVVWIGASLNFESGRHREIVFNCDGYVGRKKQRPLRSCYSFFLFWT